MDGRGCDCLIINHQIIVTMKNFAKVMLIGAMMLAPLASFADNDVEKLSKDYKYQIEAVQGQIKTNKAEQKRSPENVQLKADGEQLKVQLKDLKSKKKILDKAIKTDKKAKSLAEKAKKAQKDAENAAEEAAKLFK